jgi:hypothetical protein
MTQSLYVQQNHARNKHTQLPVLRPIHHGCNVAYISICGGFRGWPLLGRLLIGCRLGGRWLIGGSGLIRRRGLTPGRLPAVCRLLIGRRGLWFLGTGLLLGRWLLRLSFLLLQSATLPRQEMTNDTSS